MKLSLSKVFKNIMKEYKNAAEEAKNSGQMVSFFIPLDVGNKLQSMFRDVPGDMVQPEDMHITLGLMKKDLNDAKRAIPVLKDLSKSLDAFDVNIDGFGYFPPNIHNQQKYVLYAKPAAENIKEIHDTLFSLFEKHGLQIDNGSFDFNPHITIKYCDEKPEIDRRIDDPIFRIKNISLAAGDDRFHTNLRDRLMSAPRRI